MIPTPPEKQKNNINIREENNDICHDINAKKNKTDSDLEENLVIVENCTPFNTDTDSSTSDPGLLIPSNSDPGLLIPSEEDFSQNDEVTDTDKISSNSRGKNLKIFRPKKGPGAR